MAKKKSQSVTLEDIIKICPKKFIIILIAAIVMYFFGGDDFLNLKDTKPEQEQEQDNSGFTTGIVTRVVDGDTAVVKVDGQDIRVRMLGVDTPETVHPNKPVQFYGKEASNFTKDYLNGKQVWLEYDKSPTDRYNRHLAYVWTSKPSKINESTMRKDMFNARLLLGGYAKVMIIKPNKRYEELFKKFEAEAQQARKGLWNQ